MASVALHDCLYNNGPELRLKETAEKQIVMCSIVRSRDKALV